MIVAGFLGIAEGAARVVELWLPPRAVDYGLGFTVGSRVFAPGHADPATLETRASKRASFPTQQFSARKPIGTLRLVMLGESSVNFLDPELQIMRERLRGALSPDYTRVEVINAGGLSYGSHRLVGVATEVLEYEPDLLLVYIGNNEFEEVEQLQLASVSTAAAQEAASRSAAVRVLRDRITDWQVTGLRRQHERRQALADSIPNFARAWRHQFTAADVDRRMEAFRANLTRIIQGSLERGVPVILGTVPSNLARPLLPEAAWRRYRPVWTLMEQQQYAEAYALGRRILAETPGRHQSSDLENRIVRDLAREFGVPLADVEAAVLEAEPHHLPGETLFRDHCHLNDRGNIILRETFERAVLRQLGDSSHARFVQKTR